MARGFEIVKGYEDKDIHLPVRKTAHAAGYDVEAAEDIIIPKFERGIKPTARYFNTYPATVRRIIQKFEEEKSN